MPHHNIENILKSAQEQFARCSASFLDAEVLLANCLNVSRSYLFAHSETILNHEQIALFNEYKQRRLNGEPIAYITGHKEFWSLDFRVTPDVLIPRPETELLVEYALAFLSDKKVAKIAELGTGSGAIACAIASELSQSFLTATDISQPAITMAKLNASRLQLDNIQFFVGDWYQALSQEQFDLIVSNPPYVAQGDQFLEKDVLHFEPTIALISGADGLQAIRHLIDGAAKHLKQDGYLMLEHGHLQGKAVRDLLKHRGYQNIDTKKDMSNFERITYGRKK